MGTKARALANRYTDLGDRLDTLANTLRSAGRDSDANSVKNSENDLETAAASLFGIDAIDTLSHPADVKTLADLTKALGDENAAIASAENRVHGIVVLCTSLVKTAGAFASGDILGGVTEAGTSIDAITALTGWHA